MTAKQEKVFSAVLLATAFTALFLARLFMLNQSLEPNGLDGYYYALQAKSLMETGRLENPSLQPGYYLCGLGGILTGDAIQGVKLWAALSAALTSLAIWKLLFVLTKSSFLSLLGFIVCGLSPSFATMSVNYINNQTGIFLLLCYAICIAFCIKKITWPRIVIALFFFLLTMASHKITMVLSVAGSLGIFLWLLVSRKMTGRKPPSRVKLIVAGVSVAFVAILGFHFFQLHSPRFFQSFSLPQLPFQSPSFQRMIGSHGSWEIAAHSVLLYLVGLFSFIVRIPGRALALLIPILYFPFWNLESDMGQRMLLNGLPLGIPLVLYFGWSLLERLSHRLALKDRRFLSAAGKNSLLFCSTLLFVLLVPSTAKNYDPQTDPPYSYYREVIQSVSLEEDSLLIAHLGLNHVYTYHKDLKDALNWLPNFYIPPEKTWRIACGPSHHHMAAFFPDLGSQINSLIQHLDGPYTLIREDIWQEYLRREDKEIAEAYRNWFNPHQVRPDYIRKSKETPQ